MATRHLIGWHVTHFNATATHPAYAYVTIRGRQNRYFPPATLIVSESFRINADPTGPKKKDEALVREAMALSENKWTGRP